MLENKKGIEKLYREYQEKRDNTPTTVLWGLLSIAKSKKQHQLSLSQEEKEARINIILNAAKTQTFNAKEKNKSGFTFKEQFNAFCQKLFTPSFGGMQLATISAVAVLTAGITLFPLSEKNEPYLDITYLEDCRVCGQLAVSSTIKVRNIDLNKNTIESATGAAKFGQLALDLELINTITAKNTEINTRAIINTIKSLSIKKGNSLITNYFDQFNENHVFSKSEIKQSIQFLNQNFQQSIENDLYNAGQWFERLRITIDSSLKTQNFSSLPTALDGIETLKDKLENNQSVNPDTLLNIDKLSQFKQSKYLNEKQSQQISLIIKDIFKSLDM